MDYLTTSLQSLQGIYSACVPRYSFHPHLLIFKFLYDTRFGLVVTARLENLADERKRSISNVIVEPPPHPLLAVNAEMPFTRPLSMLAVSDVSQVFD